MALAHQGGFIASRTLASTDNAGPCVLGIQGHSNLPASDVLPVGSGSFRKFLMVGEIVPPRSSRVCAQQAPLLGRELVNAKGVSRVRGLIPVPRMGRLLLQINNVVFYFI